ncbi:uncharacterized protein [Cherax quadricarinatus]|uniref:uncharacterized protein isoform X2 n=1 Tax=Cherax quadricarinatus TaxID=27406 RepID=UPI00387E21C3
MLCLLGPNKLLPVVWQLCLLVVDQFVTLLSVTSAPRSTLGSFPGFSSQRDETEAITVTGQDTPPPPGISVTPGSCPSCKVGDLYNVYPTCGICAAICLFPLGLAVPYLLRGQRCDVCGYVAGR